MKIQNSKFKNQNYGIFIIFTFCVLILAFCLSSCAGKKEEPLKTVKVKRGSILAQIPSTGTVEPRNRLEIKPPIAGRIDQMLASEGQSVRKGQILAWMSSSDRAALLDAARAKGEAEVKKWEDVYKPTPIVAPLNGFIIQRAVEPGQSVISGDPVLVMADRLIVKAQVDETDLGRIKLGQRVQIVLDAYPGEKISGSVEHIAYESKIVSNVVIYGIDVLPSEVPAFFRAGMSATVNFLLSERRDVLILPLNAVKKRNGNFYVFVKPKGEKEIKAVQIEAGQENTEHIEIVSGLSEGDEVIIPTTQMVQSAFERRRGMPFNPFGRQQR
jgi:macrolide-specific efflux system membrane fusion protein